MFRLARLSLANRALIALVTVFASVFGVITMTSLKQELIPSVEFPQITVITSMPGASPEVVDQQISAPLETALNGVEGLESTSSTSRNGVSQISMLFTYGSNLDRARNQIDRAISNAKRSLPDDAQPQAIAGSISDFPIVFLAVSSDKPLSELNADLARLSVPRLQKLDGVRGAEVTGGASQHIRILPRADAMAASGATLASISNALRNSGALVPAGTIEEQGRTLSLQIGSPVDSLDAVKALPLGGTKSAATIGSVADVSITEDARTSITRTNGKETLALSVTKKPEGDTVGISHAVQDSIPQLEAELGSNATFTPIFDQAPFIEKSIKDLTTEGLLGLGFAVAVILVFLMSVRSTLVTAVSIPLSLLITFIGLSATGYSLNILTLGALTIAIGRVVDDSIVVIENIKRHLSYGEQKITAILTSIREVAGAITASTLTTVAVFLPIAFVAGLAGELFRPLRAHRDHRAAVLAARLAHDRPGPGLLAPAEPGRKSRRPGNLRAGGCGQGPRGRAAHAAAARLPPGPPQDPATSGGDLDRGRAGARGHRRNDPAAGHRPARTLRPKQHDRSAGPAGRHQPDRGQCRRHPGRDRAAGH
ncbi:multidrug efflux pump subunit AcrB [Arthrobacter sp. V1I7]|nr:multidrug efflux pump subunit AcrB [Arthrobacter sp. V1I7]